MLFLGEVKKVYLTLLEDTIVIFVMVVVDVVVVTLLLCRCVLFCFGSI